MHHAESVASHYPLEEKHTFVAVDVELAGWLPKDIKVCTLKLVRIPYPLLGHLICTLAFTNQVGFLTAGLFCRELMPTVAADGISKFVLAYMIPWVIRFN